MENKLWGLLSKPSKQPIVQSEQQRASAPRGREDHSKATATESWNDGRHSDQREQHLGIPAWDREHLAGKQISPSSAEKLNSIQ